MPKLTRKNITGLSYRFAPWESFNATAFGKLYHQYNKGPVSGSADGIGDWQNLSRTTLTPGYGVALAWLPARGLQAKFSYERAARLPSNDELFGDEDLEAGRADLKAERSDNFNLNLSWSRRFGRHAVYAEGTLVYRDTKDFIRRGIGKHGSTYYGIYENFGHVRTKGFTLSGHYDFGRWASLGASYTQMDARDEERYRAGGTLQENLHRGDRIPNQPYRFASFDATLRWPGVFSAGGVLALAYDSYWQHEFPLNWESVASAESKRRVPAQFSHNLSLSCSLRDGKYSFSAECKNLADAKLYDNYSLQKAGRAFYAKLRVRLGN